MAFTPPCRPRPIPTDPATFSIPLIDSVRGFSVGGSKRLLACCLIIVLGDFENCCSSASPPEIGFKNCTIPFQTESNIPPLLHPPGRFLDRKSTRLNSSHSQISHA